MSIYRSAFDNCYAHFHDKYKLMPTAGILAFKCVQRELKNYQVEVFGPVETIKVDWSKDDQVDIFVPTWNDLLDPAGLHVALVGDQKEAILFAMKWS